MLFYGDTLNVVIVVIWQFYSPSSHKKKCILNRKITNSGHSSSFSNPSNVKVLKEEIIHVLEYVALKNAYTTKLYNN